MGKRKERRRLAALSNAGRRVKLDLFAEPSGDLGGSDVRDKVGGDRKDSDELPDSPSSSGQQIQNPLLLLGQYSDDDLEAESDERLNNSTVESSSLADNSDQVREQRNPGCKEMDVNAAAGISALKADQPHIEPVSGLPDDKRKEEGDDVPESDATSIGELHKLTDSAAQDSFAAPSEVQATRDLSSGWKMVLHEESKQYYYWNTETGETSWEPPGALARTAGTTYDQQTHVTGYTDSGPLGTYESNSFSHVEPCNSVAAQNTVSESISLVSQSTVYGNGSLVAQFVEGYTSDAPKENSWLAESDQIEPQKKLYADVTPANPKNGSSLSDAPANLDKRSIGDAPANPDNKADDDLSARLMSESERLLEKLRSLMGSQGNLQGHDWISKYILEVEIRLSDIKALVSCGSSLLPFWLHSEMKLKHVEDIVNDKIYQLAKSAVMDEVAATNISYLEEKEKSSEGAGSEPETDGNKCKLVPSGEITLSTDEDADTNNGSLTGDLRSDVAASELHAAVSDKMVPMSGVPVVDDVDMDVDMEVEDSVTPATIASSSVSSGNIFGPTEQPKLHTENSSSAFSDISAAPPLPSEEWIPPPPPDDEEIPPPPPDTDNGQFPPPPPDNEAVPPAPSDAFQEPSYPLPVSYPQQPVPFTAQYSLTYPDSNYQYYGSVATAVPNSQFYSHADGLQIALPHASLYYGTMPGEGSEPAPAAISSLEAYYNLKVGTVPPLPISYSAVSMQSTDPSVAAASARVDVSAVGGETETASSGIPSTSSTIHVPSTVSTAEGNPVSTQSTNTSAAAGAGSSSLVKGQSKVGRVKKRTVATAPTLRSNKKVSSLVDKWKAAKEEMNESEEEEPESVLEILERKRQREIEEWCARQIASGEAKDNANFQPLGGDWREKVKRRRTQAAREAAETAAREAAERADKDENQQPDLAELSKDLPSGWQAYWGESTKQVYYGNAITSEASWTQPTK